MAEEGESATGEIFLFFGIFLGAVLSFTLSRFTILSHVPYTVLMFVVGILLSLLASAVHGPRSKHLDTLIVSIELWENIDPYLFLYVFLPVLLFGEAMTLNPHHLSKTFFPALLLAVPGSAFGAYLIALVCMYLLPNGWSWTLCFLVGTVLSSTDPVSVIALLKSEANTSVSISRLTYIVIGESMLNDASSLVLFEIVSSRTEGDPVLEYVLSFIKVVCISPLIGLLIGLGGVFCLRQCNRRVYDEDTTAQIAISLAAAYISFFVGQFTLGVSGVVSCCAAGLVFAWFGVPLILRPQSMEIVWHSVIWFGETLVFTISGLLVGRLLVSYVKAEDIASVLIVYIAMNLSRIALVIICSPILKLWSPLYTYKDACFIAFSGIRGTTSLALVLILNGHIIGSSRASDNKINFEESQVHRALFISCAAVTLTIAINGALSSKALVKLGIKTITSSAEDDIIQHYVFKRVAYGAKRMQKVLEKNLSPLDPAYIMHFCSILQYDEVALLNMSSDKNDHRHNQNHAHFDDEMNTSINPQDTSYDEDILMNDDSILSTYHNQDDDQTKIDIINPNLSSSSSTHIIIEEPTVSTIAISPNLVSSRSIELTHVGKRNINSAINDTLMTRTRNIFLEILRKGYSRQIASGHLPRGCNAALILMASIEFALETTNTPGLQDWDSLHDALRGAEMRYHIMKYVTFGWSVMIDEWLEDIFEIDRVICLTNFIEAHKYTQQKLSFYLGEHDRISTPEEYLCIQESAMNVYHAQTMLSSIDDGYIIFLNSKIASTIILHTQEDLILHFINEGILSLKNAETLLVAARHDLKRVEKSRTRYDYMNHHHSVGATHHPASSNDTHLHDI